MLPARGLSGAARHALCTTGPRETEGSMARRSLRVAAFAAALTLFALPLRAETGRDLVGRVQLSGKDGTDVAIITSSGTYAMLARRRTPEAVKSGYLL